MSTEEHVFDQLPAYALGSLDEQEALHVTRHLEGCSICRAELTTYQAVTDQLGLGAPVIAPPASLRQKVLQAVTEQSQAQQLAQRKGGLLQTLRLWFTPMRLAGTLLVLILAASNLFLWQQAQQIHAANQVAEFSTVALVGTSADPQARGMIVISQTGQYGTLVVENLRPLDANHQYQLWLNQHGQHTNGGVFSITGDGYTSTLIWSPQALNQYTGFGITIEPTGGSPQPTGEKVLGGGT